MDNQVNLEITVENLSPAEGTLISPVWLGFHDGNFDLFDLDASASTAIERIAEDGNTEQLVADFDNASAGLIQEVINSPSEPTPDFLPGDVVSSTITIDSSIPTNQYLSYASMVLPSNDALIGNDNPTQHRIFDEAGNFIPTSFVIPGSDVLDAGVEVNDEDRFTTPGVGSDPLNDFQPNTGTDENSVITAHPGFIPDGNILSQFPAADFTDPNYPIARITVEQVEDPDTPQIEAVKNVLETWQTGDKEGFLSLQTSDVVWEIQGEQVPSSPSETQDTNVIPFAGEWYGTEGLSDTAGDLFDQVQDSLEISELEPLDLFQDEERVIARVNLKATVKETGLPVDLDLAYLIDLESSEDGTEHVESVELVYNGYSVAEAFTGNSPSPESVDLSARDPLTGMFLSVNPNADSEESLQVVTDAFSALRVGNIDGYLQAFAEDSITTLNADPALLPTGNVWEGREGLRELFTEVAPSVFEIRVINPREIIANGDRVAVFMDWENTALETGLSGEFPIAQFLTVKDGQIQDAQFVFDTHIPASASVGAPIFEANSLLEQGIMNSEEELISMEL